MPALPWSPELALGHALVDTTHQEFVDLLGRAEQADDETLPLLWAELVAHTADHFDREDEWMMATGFALGNCHSAQHKAVLQVLRHGAAEAARGDLAPIRKVIEELAAWFPHHARTMDAALVLHMQGVGYDPQTGDIALPAAMSPEPMVLSGRKHDA